MTELIGNPPAVDSSPLDDSNVDTEVGTNDERCPAARRSTLPAVDLLAAVVAGAMVAFLLQPGPGLWSSRIAVLLAIAPLALLSWFGLLRRRDRAAMLLAAFVLATLLSALLSAAPGLALLGSVRRHTSFVIYFGAACAWLIGRRVSTRGQSAIGWAVVAGTIVSGSLAVLVVILQTGTGPLGMSVGRPPGLAIHPVYFGAFAAATAGWFAYRVSQRVTAVDVGGLTGAAFLAALSGSRIAFVSVFALAIVAIFTSRQRRVWWVLPWLAVAGAVATFIQRTFGESNAALDRAPASGLGDRFELWSYALDGWAERPLLGWGPGRFTAAPGSHISDAWVMRFEHSWADAHNVALEWLTTLGVVGLVLGLAFVIAAGWRARGPMAWMAIGIAIGWSVEPASAGTIGLAALLLGASVPVSRDGWQLGGSRMRTIAVATACAIGLALGTWYIVGDYAIDLTPEPDDPDRSLLTFWYSSDPALSNLVSAQFALRADGDRGSEEALEWAVETTEREGDFSRWHGFLALRRLQLDDLEGARASAERALELQPNNELALNVLLFVAQRSGDDELAARATQKLCGLEECPTGVDAPNEPEQE
jgi:O-antigen ligase